MTMEEWMNNPAMKNIDPAKLELIRMAAAKTSGKTGKDLAPVMLALISSANKQGIRFSPDEVTLILEILHMPGRLLLFSDHAIRPAGEWVCLKGRRAASALGLRPLQPYVPLCCGPSESGPARHIHSPADTSLDPHKSRLNIVWGFRQ